MKREFRVIMHKDKSLSGPIRPFLELLKVRIDPEKGPARA